MDEYDEMYGIEDDFEQQFADELEVMAEMDFEPPPLKKISEFRSTKPAAQSFEEAISSGDLQLNRLPGRGKPGELSSTTTSNCSPPRPVDEHPLTPKAKKPRKHDVAKKLQFEVLQDDDITPPSSPEVYERSENRQVVANSLSPGRPPVAMTPNILDISGFAALQESPKRIATESHHVLKRPPPTGDYVSVTDSHGNRVYLAKREEELKTTDPRDFRRSQTALGLLAVPIEVLKEQAAERRHRQIVEESQRLTELLSSGIDPELLTEEQDEAGDEDGNDGDDDRASRLWVDRFSPKHYTELLSDDFTNRCLLKWLKLWDTVVFGRERKSRPPVAEARPNAPIGQNQNQNQSQRFKSKVQITEELLDAELDQYKRPKFKVALLSGPPGLGKTTLAHVIAKHAGYNVVELNASDDRSAELFQKRIDTATQMKSVLGANERPNCLVIDEIDGAPSAAINVLMATLNRKESREEVSGPNALKKKKKKESVLLRPIICICNDLYVPALRPLRQQAFLLAFPQTQPSRLTQRLAEITRFQGMKAETGTLMALCEKTDNDIRSCINTLQFLHGRGQKHLDQRMVNCMRVGQKDQNKGLFSVWQEIFQLPRQKRKRAGADPFEGCETGLKDGAHRLQHIIHAATSNGEPEKLRQGLYDNFLSMKLRDPGMHGVCRGLDWLCFSDLLNECILHGQNYSLMRYFPFLPAAFHFLFASNSVPRINYPSSHYEALTRTQHTKNAVVAMLAEIPPAMRSRVGMQNLCLDILSLLLDLICPKLRPVNPQLYSTREKQQLCDLIDTMINYNLTYRQDRTPEGQYTYILEPPVEDVVRFTGLPPRRQLTYQAKQLIAREMEMERMRRAERAQQKRNTQTTEVVKKKQEPLKQSTNNHQQRLENIVRQTIVEIKPELDFFGRAIVAKEKPAVTTATGGNGGACDSAQFGKAVGNSDVWFRFNEGVSNAVRRNVYIRELL